MAHTSDMTTPIDLSLLNGHFGEATGAALRRAAIAAAQSGAQVRPQKRSASTITGRTPLDFGASGSARSDATKALAEWANSGEKLAMPAGDYTFVTDAPIEFKLAGTRVEGNGESKIILGQRNPGRGMIELIGDNCFLDGLTLANPDLLKSVSGEQAFAVLARCNGATMQGLQVFDFEMGLATSAGAHIEGEFYDTRYIGNFIRVLGCGPGTPDDGTYHGEDRGDGITHWGGRGVASGNIITPRDDTDCRIGIFFEGLDDFAIDKGGADNAAVAVVQANMIGAAKGQNRGGGRFRRGIDIEDYARAVVSGNTVRSTAWHGIQIAGRSSLAVVTDNMIHYGLPPGNANGAAWKPTRCGIHVYPNGRAARDILIERNTIHNSNTDLVYGIAVRGVGTSLLPALVIRDNVIHSAVGNAGSGIAAVDLAAGSDVTIRGNQISGWLNSMTCLNVPIVTVAGNSCGGSSQFCLDLQRVKKAFVTNNFFRDADTGLQTFNVASCVLEGNQFDAIATRAIVNAGTTTLLANGNHSRGGSGKIGDFGRLTVSRWTGNSGFAVPNAR